MIRLFFFLAAVVTSLASTVAMAADLTVTDGHVRVPMPGRTVSAGYFTLHNNTANPVSLIAVNSAAFEKAELHQHTHQQGVMRMEQISQIEIGANASVSLQPGGLHLMLFNPLQPLQAGESVAISLSFSNGQQLELSLPLTEMPRR